MPKTTKQKPAAPPEAQPMQPEPPKPTRAELRKAETKRQFEALRSVAKTIYDDMDPHSFQALKTFKLILDRDKGCTTPVEDFLVNLIHVYEYRNDDGEGLTLEDIQREMEEHLLDGNALSGAIRDAHFMARRYPLPEPTAEPGLENS